MKKSIHYIVLLFTLSFVLLACDDREPFLYDEDSNGAYFDYNTANEFEKIVNFSDYIIGEPDTVTVTLKVKLLGYLMDDARTLSVKTKAIEDYELADITFDEVVFANKEYEKQIEVKIKRPAYEDIMYAVCIYLDGSGDIGPGIAGKQEIDLFVTESYGMPKTWETEYLGDWSKEKHIFLAGFTGDDIFYTKLVDKEGNTRIEENIALNSSLVNQFLANEAEMNDAYEFPIIKESDHPTYNEPYFWSLYEDLLGVYRPEKFCHFVYLLGGATTKNVASRFASEDAREKMEQEVDNFHKDDVFYMLNQYYDYASMGLPISEYRNLCWFKLQNAPNYNVRNPYWWEDPDALGTAEIVKKYFGEYEDEKYQFMLKKMMKSDGADNFVAASIFPFVYDKENDVYVWDKTPFGVKQLAGEERLKECYRIIKKENDKRPQPYDIPVVDIE